MSIRANYFIIRPTPHSRKYCGVWIFDTRSDFVAAIKKLKLKINTRELRAVCIGEAQSNHSRRVAMLAFHRGDCGAGVVAHEIAHAAMDYFGFSKFASLFANGVYTKSRISRSSVAEERFCEVVENLSREFWNAWYKEGLDNAGDGKK